MTLLYVNTAILIFEAVLATYVGTRAWSHRPARLFVLVALALIVLNFSLYARLQAISVDEARTAINTGIIGLCALDLTLLLLFSELFQPEWWDKPHRIRLIIAPYILTFLVLIIDALGDFRFFLGEIVIQNNFYYIETPLPSSNVMLDLFMLSWVLHIVILGRAFVKQPNSRLTIGILMLAVLMTWLLDVLATESFRPFGGNYILVLTLPLLTALAYAVIRGRILEPTTAGLDLALQAMNEAVVIINKSNELIYTNAQATRLGLKRGQSLVQGLVAAGLKPEKIAKLIEQQLNPTATREMQLLRATDLARSFEVTLSPIIDNTGKINGTLLLGRDVTQLQEYTTLLEQERGYLAEAVNQLSYLASHDVLTGLPNRRSLLEELEKILAQPPCDVGCTLLFLDLDNFKLVNDTLGHSAGDQLLIDITNLLGSQLRQHDILARFGGDEFAVILHHVNLEHAQVIAKRLCSVVQDNRFKLHGHSFELGLSIGLVAIEKQPDAQVALAQADIAMYSAKEQGRNRVAVYHSDEGSFIQLSDANQWVAHIKDALEENRLVLHFQPIVRLSDRTIDHYEALIRMQDKEGKLIAPGFFISAVERYGLMPQVNHWIMQDTIKTLLQHPQVSISVNLSGRSLVDQVLLDFIESQILEHHIAPGRLGFEITETVAVQDATRAEVCIRMLKRLGCQFALDDFGIGFNSFAYLNTLSVDQIKIDGSFIRTLDKDPHNQAIVQAMHNLAQALNKETVAEYVQNEATVAILREIGITYGQGYYLGKPQHELP